MTGISLFDIEESADEPLLLREGFYGAYKTKKTWLAGTAAEAGFNTILIDSDHGYHILQKQLSPAAKKRLTIFKAHDLPKRAAAAEFLIALAKNNKVMFDTKTQRVVYSQAKATPTTYVLDIQKHLSPTTVLIVDSWTAICRSLALDYIISNNIDIAQSQEDRKKGGQIMDQFGWTGALATYIMNFLVTLPCHLIVIGHRTVYEKRSKDLKTVEFTRTQFVSTSGPHGMTLGDKFSDIFYFENISSTLTKIDTRADTDRDGGSRIIPPASYRWEDLQWINICQYAGIPLPPPDLPYLDFTIQPLTNPFNQKQTGGTIAAAPKTGGNSLQMKLKTGLSKQ